MMIKLLLDDNSFLQPRFFLSQVTSCIQNFFSPCFMLSCFIFKALVCLCACVRALSSVFVADRGSQRAIVFGKVERETHTGSEREFLAIVIWFGFGDRRDGDTRK